MRLAPHQLNAHLQKGVAPLYVLYGPEDFLMDESAQKIRQQVLVQDSCERIVFQCDGTASPWEALQQALQSQSLFSTQQLIEIRVHKLHPTDPAKLLTCLALLSPQQVCLIQCSPQLKSIHKAKWLQMAEQKGVVIPHFSPTEAQFQHWIITRAKQAGLTLSAEVVALLVYRTQGNCLAAAQEIERLALCHDPANPTSHGDSIQHRGNVTTGRHGGRPLHSCMTVADLGYQNQFDVFELAEAILRQQKDRVIHILSSLKETQGIALSLVLWVLAQTLRVFIQAPSLSTPEQKTRVLFQLGIRKQSHPLYHSVLHHANIAACQALFSRLSQIDIQLKSGQLRNAWAETLTVCLTMTHVCID